MLIYARVSLAHKDMEPELECFDGQTRKAGEFGELKGGFMVKRTSQVGTAVAYQAWAKWGGINAQQALQNGWDRSQQLEAFVIMAMREGNLLLLKQIPSELFVFLLYLVASGEQYDDGIQLFQEHDE